MTPLDDLFSTDESRAEAQLEKVVMLNPADISDFPNHPFKVRQACWFLFLSAPRRTAAMRWLPVIGENVRQR